MIFRETQGGLFVEKPDRISRVEFESKYAPINAIHRVGRNVYTWKGSPRILHPIVRRRILNIERYFFPPSSFSFFFLLFRSKASASFLMARYIFSRGEG